jgi:hypothetical protein
VPTIGELVERRKVIFSKTPEFYIPLSEVRKGGGVYCSNECRRMG